MSLPASTINKPSQYALGAQAQSKAAFDALTATKRDAAYQKLRTKLGAPTQYIKPFIAPLAAAGFTRVKAITVNSNPVSFAIDTTNTLMNDATDTDLDKLSDKFEKRVANLFTPLYHVSGGDPNVFATFADQPTLAIASLATANPPISHNRVTPIGFKNGIGFLQIDYLTVWNRDNGLSISNSCSAFSAALGLSLDGIGSHDFDEERSAILVGAPMVGGGYSMDPTAYKAYDFYVAAHEGVTLFDHSAYYTPQTPVDAGRHIELALSLSKHSTYVYNPNKCPIFRDEVIYATYSSIQFLYDGGLIDYTTYIALLYAADTLFYGCVVESFTDQGGAFANTRINVGELSKPINGCSWINDPRIMAKLSPNLWRV
jgi:hypothetical protein